MVVYVLTQEWCCKEIGEEDYATLVYSTFEKAQQEFETRMEQVKKEYSDLDCEQTCSENCWIAWEDGNYEANHILLRISESEVR